MRGSPREDTKGHNPGPASTRGPTRAPRLSHSGGGRRAAEGGSYTPTPSRRGRSRDGGGRREREEARSCALFLVRSHLTNKRGRNREWPSSVRRRSRRSQSLHVEMDHAICFPARITAGRAVRALPLVPHIGPIWASVRPIMGPDNGPDSLLQITSKNGHFLIGKTRAKLRFF